MADSNTVKLDELTSQVEQLSSMLGEVEENLKDIHETWTQGAPRRRVFSGMWSPSRTERMRHSSANQGTDPGAAAQNNGESAPRTEGPVQGTETETTGSSSPNTAPGVSPDVLTNLGSMFGKSPEEMTGMLKAAQQILGGINQGQNPTQSGNAMGSIQQLLAGMNGVQRQGADVSPQAPHSGGSQPSPGSTKSSDVGISSEVQQVSAGLPVKLQTVAERLHEAASQDPFIGTAVHLDSRLRDMSDTMDGVIGILLLMRDITMKYKS